jgi:hypothetical protein
MASLPDEHPCCIVRICREKSVFSPGFASKSFKTLTFKYSGSRRRCANVCPQPRQGGSFLGRDCSTIAGVGIKSLRLLTRMISCILNESPRSRWVGHICASPENAYAEAFSAIILMQNKTLVTGEVSCVVSFQSSQD